MSRTSLVTGGGSGIGLRLAELLAGRGDDIAVLDRTLPAASIERIRRAGGTAVRVHGVEVDVRDGDAVARAVGEAAEALGPPRLVVNSAGVQHAGAFADLDEAAFRRVVDINLVGSRNVAAAVLPHLEGGGHLVLVASLAGLVPNYGYAAYCASKYGVVGLAEVLRLEGAPRGVRVSCVCPPEVETPMVDEERRTMLAATRALKELAGTIDVDTAAVGILAGIDRGEFLIVPSRRARATRLLVRLLPARLTYAMSDRVVAREVRRTG